MARMVLADLFLDTSPYNAGTIASDAIRMGLPLVTLSGESFASRMAGRLLAAIGADRGIATTPADYVETAVALASDPTAHAAYKALFTEARWAETIGDIAGFTAAFEATLLRLQSDLMSGAQESGDRESGDWESGALQSGDRQSGDPASGDRASGARQSGSDAPAA
jgi:predicted O-linked N-acetylglucosamine transferase (SPINDLY family)